jgi:hypothetical protein
MKYGPATSGHPNPGLNVAMQSSEAGYFRSQMEVSADYPPPTYHWVATFAHISPAGALTTGAYFRDPSNAKIKCFVFPLVDCPAV